MLHSSWIQDPSISFPIPLGIADNLKKIRPANAITVNSSYVDPIKALDNSSIIGGRTISIPDETLRDISDRLHLCMSCPDGQIKFGRPKQAAPVVTVCIQPYQSGIIQNQVQVTNAG